MVGNEIVWEQAVRDNEYLNHTIGPNKTVRHEVKNDIKHSKLKRRLLFEFLGCAYR